MREVKVHEHMIKSRIVPWMKGDILEEVFSGNLVLVAQSLELGRKERLIGKKIENVLERRARIGGKVNR